MARRTTRVEIPLNKPEEFSKLLNNIQKKHEDMDTDSPFANDPDLNMTEFVDKLSTADALRKKSELLKQQSENAMEQARIIYGTDKGQTVNTKGTLYYMLDLAKKALLRKHKGNEEALGEYGFKVVTGTAKSPAKKEVK